jgi:lysophospholipase L1-like esterase
LAHGTGASRPSKSFAGLLAAHVRARRKVELVNLGIPGASANAVQAREVSRIGVGLCDVVVVIAGANDVQQFHTLGRFADDYANLVGAIRKREPDAGLVLLGLPQISQSRIIPVILKGPIGYLSERGNAAIREIAGKNHAAFVDLYAFSLKHAAGSVKLIGPDGLHPNDTGYGLMAGATYPAVDAVLPSV